MDIEFCKDVTLIRFENMKNNTRNYGPKTTIDQADIIKKYCDYFETGAKTYTATLPRAKPWGWIGFLRADGKQKASITIQQKNDTGVLIVTDSGSRELSHIESANLKTIFKISLPE